MKLANTVTASPWVTTATNPAAETNTQALSPFAFMDYDALMQLDVPPKEWVIDTVLPVGLLSSITAESGAGKTWLALSWMRSIASGDLWAGKYQCKPMTCGLLDLEGDYGHLKDRIRALEVGIGRLQPEARKRIHFLSDLGRINIMAEETHQQIVNAVKAKGIEVLFVDTLIRTHQYDENGADMSHVMEALERVAREIRGTVVVLHHAGKGNYGRPVTGRGSSAIKGALQHEIILTRETDKTIKISLTKSKSGPEIERVATMSIIPVENGVSVEFTDEEISTKEPGRPSAKEKRREAAMQLLAKSPLSYKALIEGIMGEAQCKRTSATDEIKAMLEESLIVKEGDSYHLAD